MPDQLDLSLARVRGLLAGPSHHSKLPVIREVDEPVIPYGTWYVVGVEQYPDPKLGYMLALTPRKPGYPKWGATPKYKEMTISNDVMRQLKKAAGVRQADHLYGKRITIRSTLTGPQTTLAENGSQP